MVLAHTSPAKGDVGTVSSWGLWDTGDVACPPWCKPAALSLEDNAGFAVSTGEEEQDSECRVSARAQELSYE